MERQVNALDRGALDDLYDGVGSLAYDPVLMLKMVVLQNLKGRRSPAKWFEEAKLNQAMQWLGRGYSPSRRTWYDFRDRMQGVVEQMHRQIIGGAIKQNLLDPATGVQDGTSVAACASRHQMFNQETLSRRKDLLDGVICGTQLTPESLPRWVPPTTTGRRDLASRIEQAAKVLDERISKNAAKRAGKRKDPARIVVSLTDPIAPLGRDKMKVFRPLYTVQYMIEPNSRLIMGYCCSAAATDSGTLLPMVDKVQRIVGGRLKTAMADAAYCSILDLRGCAERDIQLLAPVQANSFTEKKTQAKSNRQIPRDEFRFDAEHNRYWCPADHELKYAGRERKQRQGDQWLWESRYTGDPEHCGSCPLAAQCLRPGSSRRMIKTLEGQELLESQRARMKDPDVQRRYKQRGQTVELGFADAKNHRGLQRFHGRGIDRATTETGLLVVAQNLLRLDKLQRDAANSKDPKT